MPLGITHFHHRLQAFEKLLASLDVPVEQLKGSEERDKKVNRKSRSREEIERREKRREEFERREKREGRREKREEKRLIDLGRRKGM